jgi:FkbM family methyltransferase
MINSKLSESIGDGEFEHNGNLFYFNNFNIKWIEELGITPKVIIDVGAYDFGDSIRYKLSFPECQIFSFEADLERYNKTSEFAENCGIKTYNNAVFSRTDIINFYPAKCNIKDLGTFHSPGETAGQGSVFVMTEKYKNEEINTIDGVKIDFAENWVHLRKSNTEPIIRIYTEAQTQELADALALKIMDEIKAVAGI